MLNKDQVKNIARLARLKLSDTEIQKYAEQLSGILDYFEILKDVDTDNIKPLAQITGLQNIKRADEIDSQGLSEELIKCTPQSVEQNQVKVKNVF